MTIVNRLEIVCSPPERVIYVFVKRKKKCKVLRKAMVHGDIRAV